MVNLYVAFFGLVGVFARYFASLLVGLWSPLWFPYATFAVNVTGCFGIGVVYVLGLQGGYLSQEMRVGLMVGLLGGYTTFSSYCLESIRLFQEAQYFFCRSLRCRESSDRSCRRTGGDDDHAEICLVIERAASESSVTDRHKPKMVNVKKRVRPK